MKLKSRCVSIDQVIDDLQTFDVILMHGLLLSSRLIELAEFNKWSHVAMVVRGDDLGIEGVRGRVFLWESTDYNTLQDPFLKKTKPGPMLVDLRERIIDNYTKKTDIVNAVRYLHVERTEEMFKYLKTAIREIHNTDWTTIQAIVKTLFKGRILKKEKESDEKYFCSELVAYTYKRVGLLPSDVLINSLEPKDFASTGYLPLLKRAWMTPELYFSG